MLNPLVRGEGSKTNTFDNCILLDDTRMPWLGDLLGELKARRRKEDGDGALMCPLYAQARRMYKRAIRLAGPGWMRLNPYAHRHGGASRDRLRGLRDLREVQRRG